MLTPATVIFDPLGYGCGVTHMPLAVTCSGAGVGGRAVPGPPETEEMYKFATLTANGVAESVRSVTVEKAPLILTYPPPVRSCPA